MEQRVTFQEALQTAHVIWEDQTSFEIYGKRGKKTKKQVYKEVFGKKARKQYAKEYPYLCWLHQLSAEKIESFPLQFPGFLMTDMPME